MLFNRQRMNQNTEYERFTQEIYQQLVNLDVVRTTKVQHDVKLEGRSGQKHQIDVYWEYVIAGNKHRVAIECKNYNTLVPIGKVRDFKGVLDDLNGVNGIMVTKVGYQEGAKKYAQEYGISLKGLRTPRYGETIIGEIEKHIHYEVRYTLFQVDEAWAEKNGFDIERYRKRLSLLFTSRTELWDSMPFIYIDRKDDILRDDKGREVASLKELEKQIPDHPTDDFPFIFKFENAYLDSRYLGSVKVCAVKYDYNIHDQQQTIALDAGDLVKAILKDAQSNETDFVALR